MKVQRKEKRRLPRRTLLFRTSVILAAAGLLLILFFTFDGYGKSVQTEVQPEAQANTVVSSQGGQAPETTSVTILGAGDNLIHEALYEHAKTADGSYDFRPYYKKVKSYISAADIATLNQETPIATSIYEPSGYPCFNTPTQDGDALIDTGFDVINQGNNHILDMGPEGIEATLNYWQAKNIPVTGAYRNEDDLQNIRIIEKNGIKVAFLGFVEMTNGNELPADSPLRIVYTSDTDVVKQLIQKAKSMADVVVVHAHWGNEDDYKLSDNEVTLSQEMVDWGADIIFGNHVHVLQELKVLTRKSDGAQCPVMYAFGNFLSGQEDINELISGLLTVTVTKDLSTAKTTVTDLKFKPIVTHYEGDRENLCIYPLSEYTEQLAEKHGVNQFMSGFSLDFIKKIVNQSIPKEYQDNT